MERRPAVGSKCGVGILHVCQVKDHHQERSDNNIDCSPSHLAHYIKKTVTVRFILDHPVYRAYSCYSIRLKAKVCGRDQYRSTYPISVCLASMTEFDSYTTL